MVRQPASPEWLQVTKFSLLSAMPIAPIGCLATPMMGGRERAVESHSRFAFAGRG